MRHGIVALGLLIAILAACGTPPAGQASLAGTDWTLQLLRGQTLVAGSSITMQFTADQLSGSAGCNSYSAPYQVQGDKLTPGQIVNTLMYCNDPAGVMDQEQAFLAALGEVTHYRMAAGRLELLNGAGQVVLTLSAAPAAPTVALEGTEWVLTTLLSGTTASSVIQGSEITLSLDKGTASGTGGCNSYGGDYTVQGNTLKMGPLVHTEMACLQPAGVMEQEAQYLVLLQQVSSFQLQGNQLTLHTADGNGLVFQAR